MGYYFSRTLNTGFEEAISKVTEALKTEGFSVITEIDMKAKLMEKLGVEFRNYRILGACNPAFAYKALQAEEKIGVMLPCNVLVIDREDGTTEIAAVDPLASMMAVQNPELAPIAKEVTDKLRNAMNRI
jgi:uncharacterized protein (DUF302 family)